MRTVPVADFHIGPGQALTVLCGPCVIESEDHCLRAAEQLKLIFSAFPINFVFKSSYDKANRSAIDSYRGPGLDEGLRILERVATELDLPIVTDIHTPEEARSASTVCDILQIPAFLCRQTDLLVAAGETQRTINVKKGQFMAPWDMEQVARKIASTGNERIMLCDRGSCFGYNNLVTDIRSIPIMQSFGYPVCFDATHSVQLPGGQGTQSGGQREFIPILTRAAIAAGANCLFIEAHPNPDEAKSDSASVLDFKTIPGLMDLVLALYDVIQRQDQPAGV